MIVLTGVFVAARAAALSCGEDRSSWESEEESPLLADPEDPSTRTVPVDAQPWELLYCDSDRRDISDCAFVSGDETIAAEIEVLNAGECELPYESRVKGTYPRLLRRFVPAGPFAAGRSYDLVCGEKESVRGRLVVRDSDAPSTPPPALVLTRLHYVRGDSGLCGRGDLIELGLEDMDAAYFEEGGYLEAAYDNGQRFVVIRPEEDGRFSLPATRSPVTLTAVAASGARGPSAEFDGAEIDGDLVFVACDVAGRSDPASLWLLVPFALVARRRRARRAA